MQTFVPQQSTAVELVDGAINDQELLRANLRDMARANRWLGGNRAVVQRVERWLAGLPATYTPAILDVATGGGDLPWILHQHSVRNGRAVVLVASDLHAEVVAVAQRALDGHPVRLVRHDALAMPFADHSVDIVTCTQALHHFDQVGVIQLLRECARVARLGVIINDLRRSYPAYWGARLMAFGPVSALSRHDGPLSVLRAYTPGEIEALARQAAVPVQVRRARGFRLEVELTKGRV